MPGLSRELGGQAVVSERGVLGWLDVPILEGEEMMEGSGKNPDLCSRRTKPAVSRKMTKTPQTLTLVSDGFYGSDSQGSRICSQRGMDSCDSRIWGSQACHRSHWEIDRA